MESKKFNSIKDILDFIKKTKPDISGYSVFCNREQLILLKILKDSDDPWYVTIDHDCVLHIISLMIQALMEISPLEDDNEKKSCVNFIAKSANNNDLSLKQRIALLFAEELVKNYEKNHPLEELLH